MPRIYTEETIKILEEISKKPKSSLRELYNAQKTKSSYKDFYNTIFRLCEQELVGKQGISGSHQLTITEEGENVLQRLKPEKDGVWKIVIFDIPEKQKHVRAILRAKLKSLHFQKWQNSIWVSPYKLDKEIEAEFKQLAGKFFVRLIKTSDVNYTEDLEKLFK
jgi:CRISPR/Cas system-associated endoribonuclease Cas2